MICFPNAKINLGLSVLEKRTDGMHNIETCYIPIPLFDILEIKKSKDFSVTYFGLPIPGDYVDNIIVKAWNLLLSEKKNIHSVDVCLYKNIPIGSGLGGGSSNAAFFLMAMNKLLSLGFSNFDLERMAGEIGSDCPFFIVNESVIATGTGNKFSPIINPVGGMFITIVFPNINISSKDAYSKVRPAGNYILNTILSGERSSWKRDLKNDFEKTILHDFPEIEKIKGSLYNLGALYASLTGSGSAVYALSTKPLNTMVFEDQFTVWTGILD